MGDDFDLFPKRENLDPFSFGKKEKSSESEKDEGSDELFGQEERAPEAPPDLSVEIPADTPAASSEPQPPLPEPPLAGQEDFSAPTAGGAPPQEPPPLPEQPEPAAIPDFMDSALPEGPISGEKTFDEPVFEQEKVVEEKVEKSSRKSPSPFVVVGGALIIIIGLLYGALTYLKKDKPQVPQVLPPVVSVPVNPVPEPAPVPAPAPAPEEPESPAATQAQTPAETKAPADQAVEVPEPGTVKGQAEAEVPEPGTVKGQAEADAVPESPPETTPAPVAASEGLQYSVQAGAFILDSSVAELEKKLRGFGFDPFLKKGSTTAMMNMLTVGPFNNENEARTALSRLKAVGVETNMRRRDDGTAIINAGSYLLRENATSVMKKIQSLHYPVDLSRHEAKLPMTFVRVGRYSTMDEANALKAELADKGLDGIVVKLQ
jgi:cell division septation protein DedD